MAAPLNELIVDEGFLAQFDLGALIERWGDTDIHAMCSDFRKHAEATENQNERNLCLLLWAVTTFHFKPHDAKEPYGPMSVMGGHRSPIPADFSDQQLAMFLGLAQTLNIASLKARLADTVWVEKRKPLRPQLKLVGEIALASFLTLAREGLEAGDIHNFWKAFERATTLASQLRADVREQLVVLCGAAVPKMIEEDAPGLLHPLLKTALHWELASVADVRAFAEQSAMRCESSRNWHAAVDMIQFAASTYDEGEREQANVLMLRAADIFERAAEFVAGRGSGMMAANFQERTIEILRRVGGTGDRREQCQRTLLAYQQAIRDEMQSHTHSTDLSELVVSAEKAVSGRDFLDAILALVTLLNPPHVDSLVEHEVEMAKQHPLSTIFGGSLLDHDGKTIAKFAPIGGTGDGLDSPGMRHRVIQHTNLRQQICAQGQLRPAIRVISGQHLVRAESFRTLVVNSPFVPEGREHVFCVAFERMFEGRIMEALHLLLPQFENSIRHILRERGVITAKLKKDMTQEDLNLNDMMFGETGAELQKLLGADLLFDLQSILVDRLGPNQRNAVAHGKASVGEMYSPHALYFCWMTLRLCCLPLMAHWGDLVHLDETGNLPEQPSAQEADDVGKQGKE